MKNDMDKCCANCKHLVTIPKNNRYIDLEHFCMVTGYLCIGIHKDLTKVKHFSPGGRELICKYEKRDDMSLHVFGVVYKACGSRQIYRCAAKTESDACKICIEKLGIQSKDIIVSYAE